MTFRPAPRSAAFTLLELCLVLLIMALLAGAAMPAMQSAFTEQSLRGDAHQLSLMVKTAMLTTREQDRPYLITLDGKELLLEPDPVLAAGDDAAPAVPAAAPDAKDAPPVVPPPENVTMTQTVNNVLKFPDAVRAGHWETLPAVRWDFEPDGLCPLPRVRLERGAAYIEMSFNALTGDVEDETAYLP